VSVLFADLVGFTTFAEERDAEEVRDALTRYFELASDVISRYGGTVEKFIGDAVMAVWGAPFAHEDDAERAVRAGLELVDAVRALGPGIAARAAILTGEAAVTIGAANQGMVAGDLVNTASRLQSVAPPGWVLAGETTQRAAGRAIIFEEVGEQALRGKAAPIPAWHALRVVAERGGRNRSEALEAPFVGRDDELRLLKDLFHATSREGRARLVSVVGPAGIGKTRLAWEFLKYLDGLVESAWFHEGRSPAYGEGIAFWALGEMVRRRAGLREDDDEATTRSGVAAMLEEHVPDADERRWIEPALLALLGLETGIAREQLFGAWRTFFERLAASGPVVMVFEDFHFADSGLLDFVDHLLEGSRASRILVVTLARPDLLERRPDWGAAKRSFVSIYLEPLPEPAMRELLAGLVPGLPESVVRAIVARADGVPLYAVETVRMLLADGRLAREDGVYVPAGDLSRLEVPATLGALIASRLDGLPPHERALVQDAAVLGQSFTTAGLAAVSGIPEADLEQPLRSLARREILRVEADPRSPERGQHIFVQALIREVAYNTLARPDRKARHLAAARYFEGLGSDELAGALAGHYLGARANAPEGPEADALAGQARLAFRAAADRAAALGGYDNAVAFLEQALLVTSDAAASGALLEQAGLWRYAAGRYEAADVDLRRAIERYRAVGDRPAVARATAEIADALLLAFHSPDAVALLEPAAAEFADLEGDPALVALQNQLGRAYFLTEDNRRAVAVMETVLEAAARLDLVGIIADALITRGSALVDLGRDHEGMGVLEAGLRLAEAHGLQRAVERGRNNVGSFQCVRDPAAARATYRLAIDGAIRLGTLGGNVRLVVGAADAAIATGHWDDAIGELAEMLATDMEREDRAAVLLKVIIIDALRGRDVGAAAEEFGRLAGGAEDSLVAMAVAWVPGILAWVGGELARARDHFREAARSNSQYAPLHLATAATIGLWMGDAGGVEADVASLDQCRAHGPAIELRRLAAVSGVAALRGRSQEALAGLREALRLAGDHGLAWEGALVGLDAAFLLDPADPGMREIAEWTRETLGRLGAAPFLALLEARLETAAGPAASSRRTAGADAVAGAGA